MTTHQDRIQAIHGTNRPDCTCPADIAASSFHDAFCDQTGWDREHGQRAMRFIKTDNTLSEPMVKRDGSWVLA